MPTKNNPEFLFIEVDVRRFSHFDVILIDSKSWNIYQYSSNYITKKEPKSEARVSKFDWHDLSPIFLATMLLYNLKVF